MEAQLGECDFFQTDCIRSCSKGLSVNVSKTNRNTSDSDKLLVHVCVVLLYP